MRRNNVDFIDRLTDRRTERTNERSPVKDEMESRGGIINSKALEQKTGIIGARIVAVNQAESYNDK